MKLKSILTRLLNGEISLEVAEREIKLWGIEELGETVKLDFSRELRKNLPEVIFAERKDNETLRNTIEKAVERSSRAIVSRVREDQMGIIDEFREKYDVIGSPYSRVFVIRKKGYRPPLTGGRIGILTAGTSDVPVAEEVRLIAEESGCEVIKVYDAGIASLKRSIDAVKKVLSGDVDVIVVVAGMEGMLPSIVASLVDVLVIGLPTSVGYGLGGGGVSALYSMLQSCSPGIVVVNIDNSVGAAYAAISVANRAAMGRG